jgi:hypothetical protein
MQFKEDLTLIQRGTRTVTDFLYFVKSITDELALIDAPLSLLMTSLSMFSMA